MFDTVPEVSHVEAMMDGVLDSLQGTESLDLTYAQRYVIAVLDSNDITRSSVTGTEGLLSSIGDGLAKAWEYIKKMFTSIWDFFFGKKNKEDSEAAKESVKEAETAIKEVESPQVTEANVKAVTAEVEKKVDKLSEGPKKKELKKKVEEAKAAPPAQAKQKTTALIKEVYDESLIDKPKGNELAKTFNKLIADLTARKEEYTAGKGDRKSLGHALDTFLNGFQGMKEPRKGLAESKAWITWAHRCLEATDNSLETIKAMKSELQHGITDTQSKIDGAKSSQYNKKELIEEITELKRTMASCVQVIKTAEHARDCISQMAALIESCCVKTKEKS
jgi:hypothetical protein